MGLRDELTADIAEAFDGDLADAVQSFTAEHRAVGAYSPQTGEETAIVIAYSGRGVFASYDHARVDGSSVLATDLELIALQAEVTRAPAVGDTLRGMAVMRVEQDPAGASWRVQLRA
jgi:hypothetical protein